MCCIIQTGELVPLVTGLTEETELEMKNMLHRVNRIAEVKHWLKWVVGWDIKHESDQPITGPSILGLESDQVPHKPDCRSTEYEKTKNVGSEQVRHKPSCTCTEDGWRLETLNLESRGIVLSV